MVDAVANSNGEDVHEDLSDKEKNGAEQNIAKGPVIVERFEHQDDLGNHIDNKENTVDNDVECPKCCRVAGRERSNAEESADRNEAD